MKAAARRTLLTLRQRLGQPPSLRRALMSSAGVFVAALLLCLGLGIAYFVHRTEQNAWRGRQGEAARNAAQTIGALIQRTEDALVLADSLSGADPDRWSEAMSLLARQNPAILETVRLDAAGQLVAAASPDRPVLANLFTIPQSRWFLQARAGAHSHSGVQLASNGDPFMLIALPAPGGGVLAVRLTMNVLWEAVDEIHFGEAGRAYVVDGQGQVLAFTDHAAVLAYTSLQDRPEFKAALGAPGRAWFGEYRNFQGQPVVGATAAVADTEWLVFTELPQSEAFAASRRAAWVLGSLMLLFSIVTTWLAARYLERLVFWPMERLRDGAERIGEGDLSFRIRLDRRDELGRVAQAFDEMARQLDERQDQLNANAAELRQSEAELRRSEARYRAIVEDQAELICRFAPDGRLTFVNEAYCRYFGQPRGALLGSSSMPLIPEEDRALVQAAEGGLSPQDPVVTLQHRVILPDGQVRWQEWTDRALFDAAGELVEYASVGRDITERKLAEAALRAGEAELRQSEARYRELFKAAARQAQELDLLNQVRAAMAGELDLPTVLHTVVEAIHTTFGYALVSIYLLEGETLALQHQVGYSRVLERITIRQGVIGRTVRSGEPALVEDVRQDLAFLDAADDVLSEICIPLLDAGRVVGALNVESTGGMALTQADLRLMIALGQHVSVAIGRARLYAEVQESREQYRTLVENGGEGIAIVDAEENFAFANPAAHEIFGMPPGELLGRNLREFVAPETYSLFQAQTEARRKGEASVYEYEIIRPDGSPRQLLLTATPRYDRAGRFVGTFGIFRDITERKQAEAALERHAQQLDALYKTVLEINAQRELPALLTAIVQRAAGLLGTNEGGLYLARPDGASLELAVSHPVLDRYRGSVLRWGEGLAGRVAQSGAPLAVADYHTWEGRSAVFEETPFHRVLGVPLKHGERVIGVITVTDRQQTGQFSPEEVRLVGLFADQAVIAIEKARLYEQLQDELDERRRAEATLKTSEAELRRSEARYRAIVEDQAELICRFAPDGRLTFVNEAYCRYFGQPRGALLGSSFMPLIPEEDRALVQAAEGGLSPQDPVVTYQHRVILPDGQVRWQEWTDRALFDEAGELVEYASVGRDITERKLAQEQLARRAQQMDALYATSLEINAQQELPALLTAIVRRAAELVGTPMGGLYLARSDGASLELVVGLNLPDIYAGTVLRWGEGLSGRVAQTGAPESVEDYLAWPGRADVYEQAPFRRVLGVPLKRGDQVIGVITVTDSELPGPFSAEDVQLVGLFADQAVIAIEKARLYEQLQGELAERSRMAAALSSLNLELEDRVRARTAELAARSAELSDSNTALRHRVEIEQLTSAISTRFVSLGPAELHSEIQATLARLGGFAGADRCYVFQLSPDGSRLAITDEWCAPGISPRLESQPDLPVADLPWWMEQLAAFWTIQIPRVADLPAEAGAERALLQAQAVRSLAAVPLVYGKALRGFLGFDAVRAEQAWAEEDIALLRVIGQIIANALEHQRAEQALRATLRALEASEGELRALFAAMSDVVIVYDRQGVYRKVAPTNPGLLYLPAGELLGKSVQQVLPPEQAALILESIGRALDTQRPVDLDYSLVIGGQEVWFAGMLSPTPDGLAVLVARDITERKRFEEQLQYDAFHDAMTGLPNRALFLDRLGRAIERAHRRPEDASAVLFLDLDRFKVVNDSLGHTAGDGLLIAFARRLENLLRSSDTAARLGGDEFVVLLEDLKDPGDAVRVAERIQEELRVPFQLGAYQAVTSASIGIVLDTGSYTRAADVLRDADIAMYKAKALGKARHELFSAALRTYAIARLELESELRGALERGEFHLQYQPICALESGRVAGFEALLRWNSPARGPVAPSEFIPVAEETGLIIPIGEWVLRQACQQIRRWQLAFPLDPPLAINVNLSGRQFDHPRLPEQVSACLAATGLRPDCLRLELTESVFMEHVLGAGERLTRLLERGVQLQIDDFGTGYSSLAYLQRFPIHTIKIDRGFIQHMVPDGENGGRDGGSEIVRTILTLAQGLGMESIAEGIETAGQLEQLIGLKCLYGQGYFLARPLDPGQVEALLAAGGSLAAKLSTRGGRAR